MNISRIHLLIPLFSDRRVELHEPTATERVTRNNIITNCTLKKLKRMNLTLFQCSNKMIWTELSENYSGKQ